MNAYFEPPTSQDTREPGQISGAYEILNYNQQLIQFADSKAGNLILINSLFIAAAQSGTNSPLWVRALEMLLVSIAGLALLLCLSVIMSRTSGLPKMPRKDCIFFADITEKRKMDQYVRDFVAGSEQTLLQDVLRRVYVLALIARHKFSTYLWAQRLTAVAALVWLSHSGLRVLVG